MSLDGNNTHDMNASPSLNFTGNGSPPQRLEQNEYYQLSHQTNGDDDMTVQIRPSENHGCSGGTDAAIGGYGEYTDNSKEDSLQFLNENSR